ncbi:hypothetical protein RJ639_046957 [Escallonia herrerae]|uniref:Uncharacterized protein n=1 Tax=Escallonia herrerae TaxID=1293975 RepID=A0AA89AZ39_9ASTE|nr:hypothetical protein RJ639_046957 [Escallonia herrerae]
MLPDKDTTDTHCESQLAFVSLLEVPEPKGQNHISLDMVNADAYFPCILDTHSENGKLETPKTIDETKESLKNEDPLTSNLQKQISFQIGGKFMQVLMNHNLISPKFTSRDKSSAERVLDGPTSRARKYKRSASFNSRKVVLMFSIFELCSIPKLLEVEYGNIDTDILDAATEAELVMVVVFMLDEISLLFLFVLNLFKSLSREFQGFFV